MNSDVTHILQQIESGDAQATEQLLPLFYQELRRLASQKMLHKKASHTLQPTALVHEAFMRLVGGDSSPSWDGRGHFFAAAAEAMRRILIESARRRNAEKRGGDRKRSELGIWSMLCGAYSKPREQRIGPASDLRSPQWR